MGKPAATDRPRLTPLSHSFTLDCNIYVGSEQAGQRVMKSITRFITHQLKLKVNEAKSAVGAKVSRLQLHRRSRGQARRRTEGLGPIQATDPGNHTTSQGGQH